MKIHRVLAAVAALGVTLGAGCAVGETDSAFLGSWRYDRAPVKSGCPDLSGLAPASGPIRLVPGAATPIVRIEAAGCALAFELQDGRAEVAPGQLCVRSGIDAAGTTWTETTRPLRWTIISLGEDQLGEAATLERTITHSGSVTTALTTCSGILVRVAR